MQGDSGDGHSHIHGNSHDDGDMVNSSDYDERDGDDGGVGHGVLMAMAGMILMMIGIDNNSV